MTNKIKHNRKCGDGTGCIFWRKAHQMIKHKLTFIGMKIILVSEDKQKDELVQAAIKILKDKPSSNPKHPELFKYKIAKKRCRFVYKINCCSENYYVKKYVNRDAIRVIQDLFRTQRAIRSMFTCWHLEHNKIPTYEQLFALIDISKIFNRPSVIVSKECKGKTIKHLLKEDISEDRKSEIIEMLINLYVKMLKVNVYHCDPNLSNFILENGVLKLIDIDDVRVLPYISYRLLKKNLMKFNKILFLVYSREKNGNIDFNNADREYILQEVIRRYDPNIPVSKLLKYLDRKTRIPLFEVKKLVKSNDVDLSKKN